MNLQETVVQKILNQVDIYKEIEKKYGSYLYNAKSAQAREELKQYLLKNCGFVV